MTTVELQDCKQPAVLWTFAWFDGNGDAVVDDPVEIMTRWEPNRQTAQSPQGGPIGRTAQIKVQQDIPLGSFLWMGELEDLPDGIIPNRQYRVTAIDTISDLDNKHFERWVTASSG